MWRLKNPTMDYDWGSPTAIPEFLGVATDGTPVAEVWIGAHPRASSVLVDFDGEDVPLIEAIAARPDLMGESAVERFGVRLPFLVKFLAAGKPLSLQVHPDEGSAAAGYHNEDEAGIPLEDGQRTYKDPHHKPEAMIALAPTETLSGFRGVDDAAGLLGALELPWADRVAALLNEEDMRPAFQALLAADEWRANGAEVLARCAELTERDRAFALVGELHEHFPGDSGAAAPLLLRDVQYNEGEALFVPSRVVHAHVSGFGLEVMAASDNVIRAGLTSKHVDREALMEAIEPQSTQPELIDLHSAGRLTPPVEEFALARLVEGDVVAESGPKIAVAMGGDGVLLDDLKLAKGEAAFIADGEAAVVRAGEAWVVSLTS